MFKWLKSGSPWIWLTGGAVSVSLLSVLGLLLLIGWQGLSYFWPAPLYAWQTTSGETVVGQLYAREAIPINHLVEMDRPLPESVIEQGKVDRLNIKVANRDRFPADFVSLLGSDVISRDQPSGWVVIERLHDGDFFGKPIAYINQSSQGKARVQDEEAIQAQLEQGLESARQWREAIQKVTDKEIRIIGGLSEKLRLEHRRRELNHRLDANYQADYEQHQAQFAEQIQIAEAKVNQLRHQLQQEILLVEDMYGQQQAIALSDILDVWYPNDMNILEKIGQWGIQIGKFLADNPRESNSEGGVFPAIFGTVLLVILMSIIVMPLGILVAVYLHEYARHRLLTRLIHIAVINLAGIPSIVYGVFGLGFFVYTVGGSLDALFYSERLPTPTFGTPGLLWSALTLAMLTLPVVIVATEEGLSRVPPSVRHGSFALGATQFEAIWHIVLPMASPAMMTGLVLAVARAAGEVAPLMLVGAVKLASSLPIDSQFPFLHLERKFMHLGFHIYDTGFQTANIEAARPLVYATSLLLVVVIVVLNLTAIRIRNNLREKYRLLEQD